MRNLVWTFWLALILAIIGTFISSAILINQWNNYMYYSEIEGRPNYPLFELSKEIENTLENRCILKFLGGLDPLLYEPFSTFFQEVCQDASRDHFFPIFSHFKCPKGDTWDPKWLTAKEWL